MKSSRYRVVPCVLRLSTLSHLQVAKHAIYSLHKSSTRDYILKRATALGFRASVLAQMRYDLPKSVRKLGRGNA
jgi:predicted RNA methylase